MPRSVTSACRDTGQGLQARLKKESDPTFHSLPDLAGGIVQGGGIFAEPDSRQSYNPFSAFV